MNGRNNGKKLMAVRIVAHSFEIVRLHIPRVAARGNTRRLRRAPDTEYG
jgi:hypothetical protein